jgi:hypothetical protein
MDARLRQRMAESEVSQALGNSCASGAAIITQLSRHPPAFASAKNDGTWERVKISGEINSTD